MTAADTGRSTAYSGHNRVSTQALTSTAQGVASEVLGVAPELIRASWRDDQGALALSLALPIGIPSLNRVVFEPQLVLISAGFDAHRDDPLGDCSLVEEDFAEMARLVTRRVNVTG